jgi:hypothetical protein
MTRPVLEHPLQRQIADALRVELAPPGKVSRDGVVCGPPTRARFYDFSGIVARRDIDAMTLLSYRLLQPIALFSFSQGLISHNLSFYQLLSVAIPLPARLPSPSAVISRISDSITSLVPTH